MPGPSYSKRAAAREWLVEWANELPPKHFLPIDHSLHGAEASIPEVRSVVHLHGAKTPPESDGYPEDWYVPGQVAHLSTIRTTRRPRFSGITTTPWASIGSNIYAGLFGLCVIRDAIEDGLDLPTGKYEIPLVIIDRDLRAMAS